MKSHGKRLAPRRKGPSTSPGPSGIGGTREPAKWSRGSKEKRRAPATEAASGLNVETQAWPRGLEVGRSRWKLVGEKTDRCANSWRAGDRQSEARWWPVHTWHRGMFNLVQYLNSNYRILESWIKVCRDAFISHAYRDSSKSWHWELGLQKRWKKKKTCKQKTKSNKNLVKVPALNKAEQRF